MAYRYFKNDKERAMFNRGGKSFGEPEPVTEGRRYGLVEIITVPKQMTLQKQSNGHKTSVFMTLKPGHYYADNLGDEVFEAALKDWECKLLWTQEKEDWLKSRGIPYRKKKGCQCSGGKLNLWFSGLEVIE